MRRASYPLTISLGQVTSFRRLQPEAAKAEAERILAECPDLSLEAWLSWLDHRAIGRLVPIEVWFNAQLVA